MLVRDGMNEIVVTVGPSHTLREAARRMTARNVGAAVVMDYDGQGPASSPSAICCARAGRDRTSTPSWSAIISRRT